MKVQLHPFPVPDTVVAVSKARPRGEGLHFSPEFALSQIDAEELSDMCDAWRKAVFSKAGKKDPRG